jgi:MFS family permease
LTRKPTSTSAKPSPAGDDAPPAVSAAGFVAFGYRDFNLYISAKFFAAGTYHMMLVAVLYQIYDTTGDPINLAFVNLCMIVPVFCFALFTGYVADSFDRRSVLLVCYSVLCLGAAGLCFETVLGLSKLWRIYGLLACIGTARAFYGPTSNSLLPNLVPRSIFPNAVAWNQSTNKMAQICGPAAGGFLYLLGAEVVYGTAAITFFLGVISTALIRPRQAARRRTGISFSLLLEGIRYVFSKHILLGAITIDLIASLMGGVQAMLPIFAKDILDVGAQGAGILRSSMAMGGLSAALILTQLRITRAGLTMIVASACFGLAVVVFGFSKWFPLSILALAVVGCGEVIDANVRQTLLQMTTPDFLRGRVGAVSSISSSVGTEIGGFRAATMAAFLGAVPAVAIGGLVVVLAALSVSKVFPELARIKRLDQVV